MNQENSTLATRVITTDILGQSYDKSQKSDTTKITYYCYNKKCHCSNKYLESKN